MTNIVDILKSVVGIPIVFLVICEVIYWFVFYELLPWEYAGVILAIGFATGGSYFIYSTRK